MDFYLISEFSVRYKFNKKCTKRSCEYSRGDSLCGWRKCKKSVFVSMPRHLVTLCAPSRLATHSHNFLVFHIYTISRRECICQTEQYKFWLFRGNTPQCSLWKCNSFQKPWVSSVKALVVKYVIVRLSLQQQPSVDEALGYPQIYFIWTPRFFGTFPIHLYSYSHRHFSSETIYFVLNSWLRCVCVCVCGNSDLA